MIGEKSNAFRWLHAKVGIYCNGEPSTFSWVERLSSHMGAEKHPTVGSSGEYWSMNESLNHGFVEMKNR